MLLKYANVLVFILLGGMTVTMMLMLSRLLHPKSPNRVKSQPYECGEIPFGQSWIQFNIRFYVIALIFIVFDVEMVMLYPWAVVFKKMGAVAFVEVLVFIVILLAGLAYLWMEGDLDWVRIIEETKGDETEERGGKKKQVAA